MHYKVLIIGIDSMDYLLLSKYIDDLPNFRKIYYESPKARMTSVFPPDSDTAWASIYTGLNPAKHGIVNFIDPLEKSVNLQTKEAEAEHIRGKTFWDYASKFNAQVCVLLPHIAYPPWRVNGIMVSRSRIKDSVKSIPVNFGECSLNKLNTPKGVPKKDKKSLRKIISLYKKLVLDETDFFSKMAKSRGWDLFFCYSSALDSIQHYFWNYCDEKNSEYTDNSPFKNVIRDFYKLYDIMVGKLISCIDDNTVVLILSDHGHGSRPSKVINVNELLRIHGFIDYKKNPAKNISQKLKLKSVKWISEYDLGWLASRILRVIPRLRDFYSSSSFDLNSSLAYVTDLSGIKAYTYGGIKINKRKLSSDSDYEIIREGIIQILEKEIDDKIAWMAKREKVYQGDYLWKYPDILLQLKEGYGIGNKVNAPIVDNTYPSHIVPGSHKGDTPVFFVLNSGRKLARDNITLMDIAPTILDLLGIDYKGFDFDGESIVAKKLK